LSAEFALMQFPAPRSESHLLPPLPPTTIAYMAIPNYGGVASQTLKIFRQELQKSSVLRDWWQHSQIASSGPKVEDALDQISRLRQYLGDEIVLSVTMDGRQPSFLIISELREPLLAAAGIQKFLETSSPPPKQNAAFQRSGFADMQYLVWDHKTVAGVPISQMELSFSPPRHAAASWLAKPHPLGSLDFVSPKAMVAGILVLANPAQIFEEAKELARLSNSNAFATVPQAEQALKLSLKDDLLSLLGGEIAVELDTETSPQPVWKAILAVNDANHLQQPSMRW
jgi:hypothetical protein